MTVVQVQKGRLANNENGSSFFGRRANDELVNLVPGDGCWTNVFGAEGLGLETDCDPVVRGGGTGGERDDRYLAHDPKLRTMAGTSADAARTQSTL